MTDHIIIDFISGVLFCTGESKYYNIIEKIHVPFDRMILLDAESTHYWLLLNTRIFM